MSSPGHLTPRTAGLLLIPPVLWAGNAVVGRLVNESIPPITLNFLRWLLAFILLLPLAWPVLRPRSELWGYWKRFSLLGLLAVGTYNSFQYLALQTSTPINVTLVASSTPIFMLLMGTVFFGQRATARQWVGAALSILGVLLVLSRGDWNTLVQVRLVIGDIYVLCATTAWAWYSWLLSQPKDPPSIRANWAQYLLSQMAFGLVWSGGFAWVEWAVQPREMVWSAGLVAALVFVAIGPSLLAYRSWGLGVQRVGPSTAAFFANLTPLFAALLSSVMLGELPRIYHLLAFMLIVGGIVVSSSRRPVN
ncbi:MAG: DMT family transporter [Limnohabitans sp.]|jgi:drug/metabolite transporter (DMT)-like permease|nr:DMT family transporter [Limnohabitans sp.]